MTTKTLCVQNFVSRRSPTGERETEWKVSEFDVESTVECVALTEKGLQDGPHTEIEFLSVDGVRFALAYAHMANDDRLACNLQNPNMMARGRAQDIAMLIHTSGTGTNAPSKYGCWLKGG